MTAAAASVPGWGSPARDVRYAEDKLPAAGNRLGGQIWAWIHARLQEPNTITGVLVVLLVLILLLQHPLARAIGTESPPAALSGSTDSAAPAVAPVPSSSVESLGHAWSKLPDVPQRDPFVPLVGQQGTLQSPAIIGPAPQHPASSNTGSSTSTSDGSVPSRQAGNRPHQAPAGNGAPPHSSTGGGATYVVRAGDSLWSIAAGELTKRHFPSVGAAVHALYAANRNTIGTDPSYLVPGERLRLPSA